MSNGPNATPPDFGKAYSGFIKAVEAAAYGMIEPNNSKATLGTMLGHMRSYPNHFCPLLPAPGIAPSAVVGMMTALGGVRPLGMVVNSLRSRKPVMRRMLPRIWRWYWSSGLDPGP